MSVSKSLSGKAAVSLAFVLKNCFCCINWDMDLESLKGIAVPFISVLVYLLIEAIKQVTKNNEKVLTFVPVIAAVLGAVIGIICFFAMPNQLMLTTSALGATLVGMASGLAATGTHQVFKQISKQEDSKPPEQKPEQ